MTEYKGQWKDENGKDSRPHITIVMNFTRPTADKPALLTYGEVETFCMNSVILYTVYWQTQLMHLFPEQMYFVTL